MSLSRRLTLAVLALVLPSSCTATAISGQRPEGRTLLQVSIAPVVVAASTPPKKHHAFLAPRVANTEMARGIGPAVSKAFDDCYQTLYGDIMDVQSMTWKSYWRKVLECVGSWGIWTLLAICIYSCGVYPDVKRVFVREEDPDPKRTFLKSHFGCFKSPRICLCSFCCPALRWADTEHMVGLLRTWAALALYVGAALVNCIFLESIWLGLATALLIILFRQRLRKKLALPNWTLGSCCIDFFFVCFCPCCAIAQEARVANAMCQLEAKEKSAGAERPFGPSQQWVLGDSLSNRGLPPRGYTYRSDIPGSPYAAQGSASAPPTSHGGFGVPPPTYPPTSRFDQGYAGSMLQGSPASSRQLL